MARYVTDLQRTASTTLSVGAVSAPASSPRRFKVYDLVFGCEATPADNPFLWQVQRTTSTGTATTVTLQKLDQADAAAVTVANENPSADMTTVSGAIYLSVALNQRATFRWVASPGGEIVVPATASEGVAVRTPTATALAVTATVMLEEQ